MFKFNELSAKVILFNVTVLAYLEDKELSTYYLLLQSLGLLGVNTFII